MSKAFASCEYTLTKDGRINPRMKGVRGWPQPEGILVKRFTGNQRQRRKKFRQFIDFCLAQPGVVYV